MGLCDNPDAILNVAVVALCVLGPICLAWIVVTLIKEILR